MKAISLWQPWATLWLLSDPDEKVFETRHWPTHYRGPLLVHAAKKRDGEVRNALNDSYISERLAAHGINIHDLTFGALIGRVSLVNCARMDRMSVWPDGEQLVGNWSSERFAWERGPSPQMFDRPIPFRGSQGFFDVPPIRSSRAEDWPLFAPPGREGL